MLSSPEDGYDNITNGLPSSQVALMVAEISHPIVNKCSQFRPHSVSKIEQLCVSRYDQSVSSLPRSTALPRLRAPGQPLDEPMRLW